MCVLGGNCHRARRYFGEGLCRPWTAEPRLPFCPCPGRLAPLPSRDPFVLFHTSRFPCRSAPSGECLPSSLSLAKPSPWPLPPLTSPSWVCCSKIPPCLLSLLLIWRTPCRFVFYLYVSRVPLFSIIRHFLTGSNCILLNSLGSVTGRNIKCPKSG